MVHGESAICIKSRYLSIELPRHIDGTCLSVFPDFFAAAEVGAEWPGSLQLPDDWAAVPEDDAVGCGWADDTLEEALKSEGSLLLDTLLAAFISAKEGMVNLDIMHLILLQYFTFRIKRADTIIREYKKIVRKNNLTYYNIQSCKCNNFSTQTQFLQAKLHEVH